MISLLRFLNRFVSLDDLPDFACEHGVAGVVYDEVCKIYDQKGVNPLDRRAFFTLAAYAENQRTIYASQKSAITSLASFYKAHDIRMLVFKGYSLSLLYDNPSSRNCGDIDIFLFGDGEKGDKLISNLGIKVLLQVDKHSAFDWKKVHVENHASFLRTEKSDAMCMLEDFIEKEANEHSIEDTNINNVYLPNANFNAIFVAMHFAGHWVKSELNIRLFYDWALFLDKCGDSVDWDLVYSIVEKSGFSRFFNALNYITVKTFELDDHFMQGVDADTQLADCILKDVVSPTKIMEVPEKTNFFKASILKSIRYYKLSKRRNMVVKRNFVVSFYYHMLSYLHYRTKLDKRSIWELDGNRRNKE